MKLKKKNQKENGEVSNDGNNKVTSRRTFGKMFGSIQNRNKEKDLDNSKTGERSLTSTIQRHKMDSSDALRKPLAEIEEKNCSKLSESAEITLRSNGSRRLTQPTSSRSVGSVGSTSSNRSHRIKQVYISRADGDAVETMTLNKMPSKYSGDSRCDSSRSVGGDSRSFGSAGSNRSRRINQVYVRVDKDGNEFSELTKGHKSTTISRSSSCGSQNDEKKMENKIDTIKKKSRRTTRVVKVYGNDAAQNVGIMLGVGAKAPEVKIPKREVTRGRSVESISSVSSFGSSKHGSLFTMSSIREEDE
uniref:Uncharacterized protein n=1 Tax=Ditylum brightwellii TaxID=49249 RepID=A0A6V2HLG7_9STRA